MTEYTSFENKLVTAEARRWMIKSNDLTPMERKRFERWLEESDEHRAEFAAAKREWLALEFLKQLQNDPVSHGDPWVARKRARRKRSRRYARPLAAAAAVAAMAVVLGWSLLAPSDYQTEYYTDVGGQLDVAAPDGSVILLNTSTRLKLHFSDEERNVFLESGEAHFEVAHDPSRPFVVVTGTGVVRAVGTAFTVYVDEGQTEVTVTDGVVEIAQTPEDLVASVPLTELTKSRAAPIQNQRLTKGHNARISHTIEAVAAVDAEIIERKLSWQHGMLEFVNAPLSEVIDEVGRYTARTLIIADPELETYPVTITAKTNNIDGLLRNLNASTSVFDVTYASDNRVLISGARAQ